LTKLPAKCFAPAQKREKAKKSRPKPSPSSGDNGQDLDKGVEAAEEDPEEPGENSKPPPSTEFQVVDYHTFSSFDFGQITWLVDRLIPSIGCGFLAAAPKLGKTWMGLDLAIAIAAGERFLGRPTKIGPALYIGGEGGSQQLQRRMDWLVKGRKLQKSHFADRLLVGMNPRIRLDRPQGVTQLRAKLDVVKPSLLILDPFTRFHSAKENDRDSIEPVLNRLRQISEEYQCFVLVIHHAPKPKKDAVYDPLRGTSAMRAWHDMLMWLEWSNDDLLIKAELRDAEEPSTLALELDIDEALSTAKVGSYIPGIDGGSDQATMIAIEKILQDDGPMTISNLAKKIKKRKAGVAQIVSAMEDLNMVTKGREKVTRRDGKSFLTEVVKLPGGIK